MSLDEVFPKSEFSRRRRGAPEGNTNAFEATDQTSRIAVQAVAAAAPRVSAPMLEPVTAEEAGEWSRLEPCPPSSDPPDREIAAPGPPALPDREESAGVAHDEPIGPNRTARRSWQPRLASGAIAVVGAIAVLLVGAGQLSSNGSRAPGLAAAHTSKVTAPADAKTAVRSSVKPKGVRRDARP